MMSNVEDSPCSESTPLIIASKGDAHIYQDKPCFPYRYFLMTLSFCGFTCAFLTRTCLNIALVAMVNYTDTKNVSEECSNIHNIPSNSSGNVEGEFNWDSNTQSLLLAAFFYGYVVTQFPGGYFAEKFGAKYVFGLAVFIPSVISLFTPFIARSSFTLLFISRLIMGLAEGPLYPSNHALWGVWAPPLERTRATSWTTMGQGSGLVFGQLLTGYFCDLDFLGGWPLAFYAFGIVGIVWFIIWMIFAKSSPEEHSGLSNYERHYIMTTLHSPNRKTTSTPWRPILFSRATGAIYIFYLFDGIAYYLLVSGVPIYMRVILKFDASENGLMNALPNAFAFIVAFFVGFAADYIRRKGVSTSATRKIFTVIGEGSLVGFTIGMGFVSCNKMAATILYGLTISIMSFTMAGPVSNCLDIAPRFAGTVMGIANLFANIGGFLSPTIVGKITHDSPNSEDWSKVFFLTAAVYFCSTSVFTIFSKGEEQPWAIQDTFVIRDTTVDNQSINSGDERTQESSQNGRNTSIS